jgi:hypothetical protein
MSEGDSRTDELGRALAGSQMQTQIYVARRPKDLSSSVQAALRDTRVIRDTVRWVAPLENQRFLEPSDADFLHALGLAGFSAELTSFWPDRGPVWDALAVLGPDARRDGVLLVEAKSYPAEVNGPGCQAENSRSLAMIHSSLNRVKVWYGVNQDADWTGRLYQYANRLAHVFFLREVCHVQTWLVNLLFTDDQTTHPTKIEEWRTALPQIKAELGFKSSSIPWVLDVFLPARSREELLSV